MATGTVYSNPTDVAAELLELKNEWYDDLQAQYYGMHAWGQERRNGAQLTMENFTMGKWSARLSALASRYI